LRFLKSIGWYGFSYGFLVVLNLFHQYLFKVITNLKFKKSCFTVKKHEGTGELDWLYLYKPVMHHEGTGD
jgi:hypothetical protein